MDLTHDDVLEILALIERSEVAYLELQVGETRIVADRAGTSSAHAPQRAVPDSAVVTPAPPPTSAPASPRPPAEAPEPPADSHAPQPVATPEAAAVKGSPRHTEELVEVAAPVVGVFYRAPEPGAPPFVEVGSRVEVGDTLGLVEVMKMFNSVTADVAGEVVAIVAENEGFVEFGQTLLTIRAEV